MRRTEQVQGLRLMKFEEVYGRTHRGGLSQAEAAEVPYPPLRPLASIVTVVHLSTSSTPVLDRAKHECVTASADP